MPAIPGIRLQSIHRVRSVPGCGCADPIESLLHVQLQDLVNPLPDQTRRCSTLYSTLYATRQMSQDI
jgi:hypothetical protein